VIGASATAVSAWFSETRLLPILFLLAGLSMLSGFENIGIVEFQKSLRFNIEFRLLFLPRVAQFLVTIVLALLLKSYWALIVGIVVAKIARLLMTYIVHPYRPGFALSHWRDLVGFSFWTWMSSLASLVWERSDGFILGHLLGAEDLGIYLLAAEIAVLPITELVAPASRALFAGFSAAQNEGTDTASVALPIVATMLLIVAPLTIGVSTTSGCLVSVFLGQKWAAAQPLVATFAWLCVFSPFSWICSTVLTARGWVRQNFYAVGIAAMVKIGVVYLVSLTQRLDLVAMAAVACVAVESLLFTLQLRRYGGAQWGASLGGFLRIGLASGLTIAALYWSGLGWHKISTAAAPSLIQGMATGLTAVMGYIALQFTMWWLARKPNGPETRLLDLARGLVVLRPMSIQRRSAIGERTP
jgi:lipopolysaccharide exporter